MAKSRYSVTKKLVDIHEKIIVPNLTEQINDALYWAYMIDETTDSSVEEQLSIYVRFVDLSKAKIETQFLCIEELRGSPNADCIFNALKVVVVVNHCFTSLFGTNGLLSDIVIR